MANWRGGFSGALSGAGAGASIGGPIGGVLGGAAGFLGGLLGPKADPVKDFQKAYKQGYGNLSSFQLPSQYQQKWEDYAPIFGMAQQGIQNAYGGALSGLEGSAGYGALNAGSGMNQAAFRDYLSTTRQGRGELTDILGHYQDITGGGPAATAAMAPEMGAISDQLSNTMANLDAWGVGGGSGAGARSRALLGAGEAQRQAYLDAVRNAWMQRQGIGSELMGFRPATYNDPSAQAMLSAYGGLLGNQAGAMTGLYGSMMDQTRGIWDPGARALAAQQSLYSAAQGPGGAAAQQGAADQAAWGQQMAKVGEAMGNWYENRGKGGGTTGVSDRRVKDDPGRVSGALSDIGKLPVYDYRYNERAESVGIPAGTPGRGVMAQDLEKNPRLRHLVHKDPNGVRSVDVYGLAATTLRAVQELDTKLEELRRKKDWKISKAGRH